MKEKWPKIEAKPIGFYPLIISEKRTFENKQTTRRFVRSKEFEHKWYAPALPRLYARQIAKYHTWFRKTKGRAPLELPYSVDGIYDSDEIEVEFNRWDTRQVIRTIKTQLSGEEILEAELED